MYPTLVLGFLMVASAVLYAMRGEARYVALMVSLGVTTLGVGLLGFCLGVVSVCRYLHEVPVADQVTVGALGVAESLHNLVLALSLVVLTGVIASVGAYRGRADIGLSVHPG